MRAEHPFGGCGLAGVLRFDAGAAADREPSLAAMVRALAHRGPDGEGTWRHGPVALGHRRLSILDLTPRGAQPMVRGQLTIVLNGEIYNFVDVRRELLAEGFSFESGTDTEVLLRDSVRLRLVSDVPVAAFLSGGIDSSLLNAIAGGETAEPLQSFTVRYRGDGVAPAAADGDDLAHAMVVAAALGDRLDHRLVEVEAAALDLPTIDAITDLAALADDERHPSVLLNYRAIRDQGLKVVLNGHGADETQGGYLKSNPFVRGAALEDGAPAVRYGICPNLALVDHDAFHPDVMARRSDVFQSLADHYASFPGEPLRRGHAFLVWTQLQRVLRFEDLLSMRWGVECRLPYLDHRIVEWAFRLPFASHVDAASGEGKALIRRAARELLPAAVVERPKRQFPKPQTDAVERAYRTLFARHRAEIVAAEVNRGAFRPGRLAADEPLPLGEVALAVLLWRWEEKLRAAGAGERRSVNEVPAAVS